MEKQEPFQLDVVSIRLVRNAPLFSDRKITGPRFTFIYRKLCGLGANPNLSV